MTFVLNILHKDYSLVAADRQGNSNGPGSVQVGSITVNFSGKFVIEGINKIISSNNHCMALGFAGTVADHGYQDDFRRAEGADDAMRVVRNHMESFYDFKQRDLLLEAKPQMQNQTLLSFFDEEKSAYFTSMSAFTRFSNHTAIHCRRQNPSPILCHIGSGSSSFESAVGIDTINRFIDDLKEGMDLATQFAWLQDAFAKVSAVASGCGKEFSAILSTRQSPKFVRIRSGSDVEASA